MSIRRIGKQFAANNAGQIITVLTQLMMPPAFLHAYGIALYGQWIALTAALSYLGTLNFGLQTYTNMQMTIHYNRGELKECLEVQSAGLRILLATALGFCLLLLVIFLVPLDSLLHFTIPQIEAQWTLYILGCQIMTNMIFGFFSGNYMVVGSAHRGTNMQSLNQLCTMLAATGLALYHASFPVIAGAQVAVTLLGALLLIFDLRRVAPAIRPTLRYWKPGSLSAVLKPSGQYALLYSANVLAYQLPAVLMQRIVGPAAVVVYTVTRTIYSMSRKVLVMVTNSIGPEITITYGQQDWRKLHRLYELSERIILLLTVPITFGSMLATPLLLQIWLHKGNLYDPAICLMLGITVSVLGIKEHKYQFQFSSNQVREISYATILVYTAMILVSIPMMHRFGLMGFLVSWCVTETIQLFYLLHLNGKLFAVEAPLDRTPVYQLFGMMALGSLAFFWLLLHIRDFSYIVQGLIAVGVTLLTGVISYKMFEVDEIREVLWRRIAVRLPAFAKRG